MKDETHSDADDSELDDLDFDRRPDESPATTRRPGRVAVQPRLVPGKGLVVPKAYLRDAFRISAPRLEKFRQEGMPCEVIANGVWQVSLYEFLRWYANRRVIEATAAATADEDGTPQPVPVDGLNAAKQREREAVAGLKELQLQRERGEVITIADAAAVVAREYGTLRSTLLAIPSRTAQKLAAVGGLKPDVCEDVVAEEINAALEQISNHDGGEWVPDVDSQQAGA